MTTRLPPPPDSEVETLARLQSVGEPLDIVRFCERRLVAYPFWLDLNRVSHAALGRLGESAANAAASLAGEVRQLLARLPVLVELSFANGQPFYDGNPIVNLADRPNGKAARIVQQCPREFCHDYTSFEQAIELSGPAGSHAAREKIIVLTLTQETARRAEAELRAWFAPA